MLDRIQRSRPATNSSAVGPLRVSAGPKRESLSMKIYAAMLGDAPRIEDPVPVARPRLKMRVKLEARLEHAGTSPFVRTTLREHFERCAAYAMRAIDEARGRLTNARPKPMQPLADDAEPATPVVLIGKPTAKSRRAVARAGSQAA